jgi:hypothetical protein
MDNSLICESYDTISYAKKIKFAITNRKETEIFKEKAYKIGEENFDYKTIATKIYNFLFN